MIMAALFHHISRTQKFNLINKINSSLTSLSAPLLHKNPFGVPFQVRSIVTPAIADGVARFDEMIVGTSRKCYLLGGKGGVGKTSCAASLAVKFANHGHPTILVSTDPAHSLSDSLDQDLSGGNLVRVQGVDSPLYAVEINADKGREEISAHKGSEMKDFIDGMGLGSLGEQLAELNLEELFLTNFSGWLEILAIAKIMQLVESEKYHRFTRIVLDTAATGHTLWLLSLPDFGDAAIGKMMKMKNKVAAATSAFKSFFGKQNAGQDNSAKAEDKLTECRETMAKVRELFHDSENTEFVMVTIPTVMAINESSRLCATLRKQSIPVSRLIVNQVLQPSTSDCKFCQMKRKDQIRALETIQNDPELSSLKVIKLPLFDAEIRGVPALKYMGDMVWR